MLETFKARLKAKTTAAGVNLSQKRIDAYADRLHKKHPELTEEAEHDTLIDELNEIVSFQDIAKQDDTIRSLKAKEKEKEDQQKQDQTKGDQQKKDGKDGEKTPDEVPAWAKAIIDSNKQLSDSLLAIQKEKAQQSIMQKVQGHEKLKELKVPEKFWNKRPLPEKDEDIDAFVEEIGTDFNEFQQSMADEGFKQTSGRPILGSQGTGAGNKGGNEKLSPSMTEYLKEQKTAQAVNNGQTQKV